MAEICLQLLNIVTEGFGLATVLFLIYIELFWTIQ